MWKKKENQHLTNGNRDDLISVVIDEVIANDIILRGNDFVNLLEQIINLFPNEKGAREYYYIPRKGKKCPSGKLYGKYVNQRSKKRKTIYLEQNTPSPASTKTNPSTKNYEVPEIYFTMCRALKASLSRSIADWNEVRDKWQKTFNLRQNDIKELTNIDFLQAWPKYSDSRAPDLIKLDFNLTRRIACIRNGKCLRKKFNDFMKLIYTTISANSSFLLLKLQRTKIRKTTFLQRC
ncbi:PREDICTED: uncharacterized protein LOC108358198 isoform X2 [Rhagoletis zephyria]|uniref:uncharacterized protein LOC108358198 isoform X2 n=1 Tax=Rhagoletis zephyria TaxID=28612 RepID=UPI000811466F|nr:PREDICTED: uncharacterized protein LOC108358198 isoform X2 [Rhagoletis zephyria]